MVRLHEDPNFHYEAIRAIGLSRYYGGDINEQLTILDNIAPRDYEGWYREWNALAKRVLATIDESNPSAYSPVTLRDVYFRASRYFFTADFFLHGNPEDPRLNENFKLWEKYFDLANEQLAIPGKRMLLPTPHGFDVPMIIYRAAEASPSNPRPTLIVGGGFDSNIEECLHVFGFPALERGYNVILYEGPGQPGPLQNQKKGFIFDWEKVVTPVVDYVFEHSSTDLSYMDTSKLGLVGMSLGGYLSARAAAFEPRFAGVMIIDGVWDFYDCVIAAMPGAQAAFESGDREAFNKIFEGDEANMTTNQRWIRDHLKYTFRTDNGFDVLRQLKPMTMSGGVAEKISMPAFVGDAMDDIFFGDQPAKVVKAIGEKATLKVFGPALGGQEHCQSGALVHLNQSMYEWFAGVIGVR